jgi:cullin 3
LAEETDRTAHYLSTLTHPSLQDLLVSKLLTPNLLAILEMPGSGLVSMLDSMRTQDLRRLYSLFLRVPHNIGKDALRLALRMDVEERGKGINDTAIEGEAGPSTAGAGGMEVDGDEGDGDAKGKGKAKAPSSGGAGAALAAALRWVQDVLDLKDKFDEVLDEAFGGDKAVQSSINEVSLIAWACH